MKKNKISFTINRNFTFNGSIGRSFNKPPSTESLSFILIGLKSIGTKLVRTIIK
ncbi:hypothetical protein [Polaribacter huanghezhanensis]|uniref:hypothetical protein n=1 Tax=Polaribacter huanghezhanensis TaxID=1354726 RepID=UPI0026485ACA|nr:hypothetical protein [Polaribacter huanghezhanensis]